jgi:protein ImuB
VRIPDFPIVVHAGGAGEGGPVVVVRGRGARAEVAAVSRAAARCGVRPGMRCAEARARASALVVRRWDEARVARAEVACVAALLAASPRVARAGGPGDGAFWLEVGDWSRRGGERAFAETAGGAVRGLGYPCVRVGLADTAAAAWAAARAGRGASCGAAGVAIVRVPPGRDREFLAPLPLDALPSLPASLLELCDSLGLARVGDLARLAPASVAARLGADGLQAWRWAHGRDGRRPFRSVSARGLEVVAECGGLTQLEPLLFLLRAGLDRLAGDLARRGECARTVECVLRCEDGSERVWRVGAARPTRAVRVWLDLLRAHLEEVTLPAPAVEVALRVAADDVVPATAAQGDLFEPRWTDPQAWAAGYARLVARYGDGAVVRPEPRDTHRPEGWGAWVPVRAADLGRGLPSADPRAAARPGVGPRPGTGSGPDALPLVLHLFPHPVPLAVRTAEGRPVAIRVDGRWARVDACAGPERLSGEWWGDPYRRTYYRVSAGGGLYWIFRDARDGAWKWHGWWD